MFIRNISQYNNKIYIKIFWNKYYNIYFIIMVFKLANKMYLYCIGADSQFNRCQSEHTVIEPVFGGLGFNHSVISEQYWMCLYWKKH